MAKKKLFVSLRIIEGANQNEVIESLQNGMANFIENHNLSDRVFPLEEINVLKPKKTYFILGLEANQFLKENSEAELPGWCKDNTEYDTVCFTDGDDICGMLNGVSGWVDYCVISKETYDKILDGL